MSEKNNYMAELVTEFMNKAMEHLDSRIPQAQPSARMTMTVEEMAKELNLSKTKAYALTKTEGFPIIRIDRRILVSRIGLQEWINRGGTANVKAC